MVWPKTKGTHELFLSLVVVHVLITKVIERFSFSFFFHESVKSDRKSLRQLMHGVIEQEERKGNGFILNKTLFQKYKPIVAK